jgi:hypothetical protein
MLLNLWLRKQGRDSCRYMMFNLLHWLMERFKEGLCK